MAIWTPTNKTEKADLIKDLKRMADSIDDEKVQKETGKRLITSEEATKLAELENYDDTKLNKKIEEQATKIEELEEQNKQLLKDHKPIPFNSSSNHLQDTGELPILDFGINGGIEQDSRVGYNKIKVLNKTGSKNGIDYVASNGTVTVNGTATKDTYLYEMFEFEDYEAGDYFVSGCPSGGDTTTYNFGVDGISGSSDFGTGKQISVSEAVSKRAVIIVRNGATVSNLVFKPMVTSGTIQKEWEQYGSMPSLDFPSEVKGVSGHYDTVVGNKNLAKLELKGHYRVYSSGVIQGSNDYDSYIAEVKPNTTYTITRTNDSPISNVAYFDKDMKYISGVGQIPNNVITPVSCKFFTVAVHKDTIGFMIEENTVATDYVEHQEQNYALDIPFNMYSGKPYKENGKWYRQIEWYKEKITSSNVLQKNSFGTNCYALSRKYATRVKGNEKIVFSNYFKGISYNDRTNGIKDSIYNEASYIVIRDTTFTTVEELKTFLDNNNVYIVYQLATPTIEEITDTTLIAQLEALQKSHSYYEVTNINSYRPTEDVAEMKLSGNALMSNDIRLSKLESAILSIGGI